MKSRNQAPDDVMMDVENLEPRQNIMGETKKFLSGAKPTSGRLILKVVVNVRPCRASYGILNHCYYC